MATKKTATPVKKGVAKKAVVKKVVAKKAVGKSAVLVAKWGVIVEAIEKGYGFGLFDYRNDLDVRSLLAEAGAGRTWRTWTRDL